MKKVVGYIMNRVEKYQITNGDEDTFLTFITLISYEGIKEYYAIGDVVDEFNDKYSKGDRIECTLRYSEEIIFGKTVCGRILSV
ncbi:hypothetical protein PT160_07735 [Erysipelothrix rhusiopathiae]|nr:hypothetical protein [Erysipelothrix rhusiopathiae]MDE8269055.1 hypothetical protein [Erysipelothrix rhusiopathiae]MDE8270676.1 hypothetical protein [Erysipelothrix rhusiopathiae]MDE8279101.1 hypothetical protein [Erysipelothrix rhusiopathiae]MDE8319413.1 hypothetical protein [Erysipelothrix rhusiopathiae]